MAPLTSCWDYPGHSIFLKKAKPPFGKSHSDPIIVPLKVGDALVVATPNDEDDDLESMATDLRSLDIDLSGLTSLESLGITDDIEPSQFTYQEQAAIDHLDKKLHMMLTRPRTQLRYLGPMKERSSTPIA